MIEDVDKVSALFESRGADASQTRAAQASLLAALAHLQFEPEEPDSADLLQEAWGHRD